jgi:methylenetetrahydrofolate reductase (NADPH)
VNPRQFHIEVLSPKQSSKTLEEDLKKFAEKYRKAVEAGYVVCIPDNPLGKLGFQGTELIKELRLPAPAGQVSVHLNTFHTKKDLDWILRSSAKLGIDDILVVSGDGSERLPKLQPEDIGENVESVTSVELVRYVRREYASEFRVGVAFNPYEPQVHEMEKMRRKVDAGAEFVTTQPIFGKNSSIEELGKFGLQIVVEAWMSKKLHLLTDCVGYEITDNESYDPMENLRELIRDYPDCGYYLAILGFKTQFPKLAELVEEKPK